MSAVWSGAAGGGWGVAEHRLEHGTEEYVVARGAVVDLAHVLHPHRRVTLAGLEQRREGKQVVGRRLAPIDAHQAARTPYAATGPIFVRCAAGATRVSINEVPAQQRRRLLSVRAYDATHTIVDAEVAPGTELEALIDRFLGDRNVSYLHVHNARRGCYACRIDRL